MIVTRLDPTDGASEQFPTPMATFLFSGRKSWDFLQWSSIEERTVPIRRNLQLSYEASLVRSNDPLQRLRDVDLRNNRAALLTSQAQAYAANSQATMSQSGTKTQLRSNEATQSESVQAWGNSRVVVSICRNVEAARMYRCWQVAMQAP